MVNLTLPEPPSVNRIWRTARGRTYKVPDAKHYGELVALICRRLRITEVVFAKGVPVRYTMTWYRARRTGDLSNRIKVVEDALNGVVWHDDGQVCEIHLYRREDKARARVELTIEECV